MAEQEKKMSVAQMREILKAKGVRNTSVMRKGELQKLMAERGFWKNNQMFWRKTKSSRLHQLRKGRNMR